MPGTVVDIKTDDGIADAHLSRPEDEQRHPGVLLIMDAYGLRPWIEAMADRIAAAGYVVLAPNVFYRGGRAPVTPMPDLSDPDERTRFFQSLRPLIAQLTPDAVARDAAAYLDYLMRFATEPVAITGYCMGARVAWRIAGAYPDRVAALAGFHGGGLATDAPDSPHRSAGQIRAEVYFGHADQDPSMAPEQIAVLDQALDDAGVSHVTEVYEGAMHGYTMGDTPSYNEAASERHFKALFGLLEHALEPV